MNVYKKIFAILVLPMLFITCKKSEHQLGAVLDKSKITFSVTQDFAVDPGGNTVIIKNTTPATLSFWDFEIGTSNRPSDTVRYAFAGDHTIKLLVSSGGSLVEMDPVVVKVTTDNFDYVNDELWIALSGGPGNEKSWVLDTEGKVFNSPMYFYGTGNGWLLGGDKGCYNSTDCWAWEAGLNDIYTSSDPIGNPIKMEKGDYGVMTFSLKGAAGFHAVKLMEGGKVDNGAYVLNTATKVLTITNGTILRGYKPLYNGINGISDWTNYTIMSLSEDKMQLAVTRDKDVRGEGKCKLVYNFIVKK